MVPLLLALNLNSILCITVEVFTTQLVQMHGLNKMKRNLIGKRLIIQSFAMVGVKMKMVNTGFFKIHGVQNGEKMATSSNNLLCAYWIYSLINYLIE